MGTWDWIGSDVFVGPVAAAMLNFLPGIGNSPLDEAGASPATLPA